MSLKNKYISNKQHDLFYGWVMVCVALFVFNACNTSDWQWESIEAIGEPTPRHEAGFVAYKDKLLLIGGRRINPTDEFDTKTNTWTQKSPTPIELHHFQPVVVGDTIFLIGAMTGKWPNETPLDRIIKYYPESDTYEYGHTIPEHRRRGGAGAVYYNEKIYLVGGIINGHMNGYKPWFDTYNPKTGAWEVLPDAPDARDHFQAAVVNNQLFALAGRTTSTITQQDMALTSSHGNIYDFEKEQWLPVTNNLKIPTERAGNAVFVWNNEVIVGGGESLAHEVAHNEVEAFNSKTGTWQKWPSLIEGRHGSGFGVIGDYVYVASGSGNRGGGPELTTIERLKLPKSDTADEAPLDLTPVYKKWHTVTLDFEGPNTSETAKDNPFLNYRLDVVFKNAESEYTVRGFYAADGNAAETSAESGNIWKVRFTPDTQGEWTYSAKMQHQDSIAIKSVSGETVNISNAEGKFIIIASDKEGRDFRANGHLGAHKGYYKFKNSNKYWIKGGANSPENLFAFKDFDGTYRMQASSRDGEASTTEEIHSFASHRRDWKEGDPTWKEGKGKALIGAFNYLSSKGMNSAYFLTMNILGDGKDVWPFHNPEDFTRFDVSKLAQWELAFQHMQSRGILLHVVLQETENETLFDEGNTGPIRKLYLNELVARFGHHLALNWNLGEENGPASWSPIGQNDAQRKAMSTYLKKIDPYNHPVLLHTHSHDPLRSEILDSITGFQDLDGLSLQQDKREFAPKVVESWREKSKVEGKEWLITMDEIGMWHTAAVTDAEDPHHDTLRRYALWGTLLSGAAGVEWYFGAKHPHNDLTSEDWRQRDRLWELTNHAIAFFETHLPFWQMEPNHTLINSPNAYCFQREGEVYAIYLPSPNQKTINLTGVDGQYDIQWYDPLSGGTLQYGSKKKIEGGGIRSLGSPPTRVESNQQDWVCLIKKEGLTTQNRSTLNAY